MLTEENWFICAEERLHIYLRDIKGYNGELQKVRYNDTEMVLRVTFKPTLAKKLDWESGVTSKAKICIC